MQIISLSNVSSACIGFAKRKYFEANAFRKSINVGIFKRLYYFNNVTIIIIAKEIGGKIILYGGSPQIFLTNGETASAYSYRNNTLSNAIINNVEEKSDVFSMFNGRVQAEDFVQSTFDGIWTSKTIGSNLKHLGNVNKFELSFMHDGQNVYARHFDTLHDFGTITNMTMLPEMAGSFGNMFFIPYFDQSPSWAQFNGACIFTLNPVNKNKTDSWYWVPSFFSVAPADPYYLFGGFYYGEYPAPQYGYDEDSAYNLPLTTATVRLAGIIDSRAIGSFTYGYCEIVEEINGEVFNDLWLYAQPIPLSGPQSPYFYNELVLGSISKARITIGSELHGFPSKAKIKLDPSFAGCNVKLWNYEKWYNKDSILIQDTDAVCLAVTKDKNAIFYRYAGYVSEVYSTENFHSFSISNDGKMLAIFESKAESELISNIVVFDLYGKRDPENSQKYIGGGITKIISSNIIEVSKATSGCFVPFREKDFVIQEDALVILNNSTPDTSIPDEKFSDYMPSQSILSFQKDGASPLSIEKVTCTDGLTAKFEKTIDKCFESEIIIDDPELTTEYDRLISSWLEKGGIRGHVRGNFTGNGDNRRFYGVGKADVLTVTLPKNIGMMWDERFNSVSFKNVVGDLILGSCLEKNDGIIGVSSSCIEQAQCGNNVYASVKTTCGQSGQMAINVETFPMAIHGSDDFVDGNGYTVSGGMGPYSWSSAGTYTVSDDTNSITIISASGTCGTVVIQCTDSCGNHATMEARSVGHWVFAYDHGDPFWASAWMVGEEISGGKKTIKLYVGTGCVCFDNQILLSPAGSCQAYNPYCDDDIGDVGGYWWGTADSVFGDVDTCKELSTPSKKATDIPGFSYRHGSQNGNDTYCETNAGNNYHWYGFRMYSHKPEFDKGYTWECP